jgi:hypothetical protein
MPQPEYLVRNNGYRGLVNFRRFLDAAEEDETHCANKTKNKCNTLQ